MYRYTPRLLFPFCNNTSSTREIQVFYRIIPNSELFGQPNELPVDGKPDSDLLSNLFSSIPKTDTVKLNELPISTPLADNKVPDELLGSPQEINAVTQSETLNITLKSDSTTPNDLLSNTPETDSNLPSESTTDSTKEPDSITRA